jgi:phosphoribosylanthranilate isomerase
MGVRVKTCGMTNLADAMAAVAAGADALGFIFYERSPRAVPMSTAAEIIRALPPFITSVGVFVDAPAPEIVQAIAGCRLDAIQLHGNETPEFCAQFAGVKVVKAFRMENEASLAELPRYSTSAWLLDTYHAGQHGGTGKRFDWTLAQKAVQLGRPVILAGGLTPDNVREAVRSVRPYAVDVSSGVESSPGKKDHARVQAFIRQAKMNAFE